MQTLATTPMQIDEPVYWNYNFSKITMEAAKAATVNYYVIDRLGKVYFKDSFDIQDKKEFVVAYKLQKRDRYRDRNLEGTQTEKDVSDFETRAVTVKISSLLEQFTAKTAKHQPLPPLEKSASRFQRTKTLRSRPIEIEYMKSSRGKATTGSIAWWSCSTLRVVWVRVSISATI